MQGHAIEVRVNAEDPFKDFRPAPGRIQQYLPPGGVNVRMDSHLYTEYVVPPNYDSLLGKLIVWGKDRAEAISRMRRCINETVIVGAFTLEIVYLLGQKGEGGEECLRQSAVLVQSLCFPFVCWVCGRGAAEFVCQMSLALPLMPMHAVVSRANTCCLRQSCFNTVSPTLALVYSTTRAQFCCFNTSHEPIGEVLSTIHACCAGVPTTLPYHDLIMSHPKFQEGDVDTGFILKYADDLIEPEEPENPNPNSNIVAQAVKKKGKR